MQEQENDFNQRLDGRFVGVLRWDQLDDLWQTLENSGKPWYLYQVGSEVPEQPLDGETLKTAIRELDQLLHQEHDHDYCGIVYADDLANPTLVKVYDPNHLGASCGSAGYRIPARWFFSLQKPSEVHDQAPTPNNRKRWWNRLFS